MAGAAVMLRLECNSSVSSKHMGKALVRIYRESYILWSIPVGTLKSPTSKIYANRMWCFHNMVYFYDMPAPIDFISFIYIVKYRSPGASIIPTDISHSHKLKIIYITTIMQILHIRA